jgi:hypothetical protein
MKEQPEEWRPIDGWPYEVSNMGRVRRALTAKVGAGRIVRPIREYVRVGLQRPGKRGIYLVHGFVAKAFLPPRPEDHKANHKDGDKQNNHAENLEWTTRNANQRHAYDLGLAGRGESAGRAKLNDEQVREIRRVYQGRWGEQSAMARQYGVSQSLIAKIVRAEIWTHLDPHYKPKECRELRTPRSGEAHGQAKLTWERVRAAREAYRAGVSIAKLAMRNHVATTIMRDVLYGKTWKEVT